MRKPFVFINIAASVDGKISNEQRRQIRISSNEDLRRVDRLRAESDAIMVGIGTVLSDDPKLTVKSEELRLERIKRCLSENPIRVIVDSKCRIPLNAKVLNDEAKTIVAVSRQANKNKVKVLMERGVEVVEFGEKLVDLRELMNYLYNIGVRKVMVEGGATLNYSLLKEKLVDEIYVYYGNIIIGGQNSPTIVDGQSFNPPINLELISVERLGNGVLTKWIVKYL
ncbi:MAG TPA: 2,5-diamino-6-(ribosylamino)-4(3H)-pyrimidinone 5'-phosphate reductase [Archaeoglobus profundus]|nr:2,5-diamino-6-(ribosylamino)-4(3H)-pyrimidinone 5'-phosphate reductase [Archaeoglobus profundus]